MLAMTLGLHPAPGSGSRVHFSWRGVHCGVLGSLSRVRGGVGFFGF